MPKVFLVKRRSPGVSVRSWDELPDEERADTYIPGEQGAGPRPGRGAPGVRAAVTASPRLGGWRWAPRPQLPLPGGQQGVSEVREDRGERLGKPRQRAPPSP